MIWVVEDKQHKEDGRHCDKRQHHHVMSPLIIVTVEEVIAMTYPILQTAHEFTQPRCQCVGLMVKKGQR